MIATTLFHFGTALYFAQFERIEMKIWFHNCFQMCRCYLLLFWHINDVISSMSTMANAQPNMARLQEIEIKIAPYSMTLVLF